jgi:SPP1 gp7 family putative phage head morphogenesis protein
MAKFSATAAAERQLASQLRRVARIIGGIVEAYTNGASIRDKTAMNKALDDYSKALGPWAEVVTGRILQSVSNNNERAWTQATKAIGKELRTFLTQTPIGAVARQLQAEQVELIKSLPLEAGLRAQSIAQEASIGSKRADVAAQEIARTGKVTESRATLIARTEIAKANAVMTQARAQGAGITHYVWRTAEDGDVRASHAMMNGKIFRFDDPPMVEGEGRHGPGEIYNCRCFAEPVIPEE